MFKYMMLLHHNIIEEAVYSRSLLKLHSNHKMHYLTLKLSYSYKKQAEHNTGERLEIEGTE